MKIHGLQKMTLLDFPGKVACTVFLGGCDWRCPFCHNFELADGTAKPVMDSEELLDFLKKRTGLLDAAAFTGGEPCLHRELPELIRSIRDMGFAVKLDTNGCHPDMLNVMLEQGLLDYVAMDIKNSPAKYPMTVGMPEVDMVPVYESIDLLLKGSCRCEFRTTVVKELHEEADFEEIGKMIAGADKYFLQSFTDRDSVPFTGLHAPDEQDLKKFAAIAALYVKNVELRGV